MLAESNWYNNIIEYDDDVQVSCTSIRFSKQRTTHTREELYVLCQHQSPGDCLASVRTVTSENSFTVTNAPMATRFVLFCNKSMQMIELKFPEPISHHIVEVVIVISAGIVLFVGVVIFSVYYIVNKIDIDQYDKEIAETVVEKALLEENGSCGGFVGQLAEEVRQWKKSDSSDGFNVQDSSSNDSAGDLSG